MSDVSIYPLQTRTIVPIAECRASVFVTLRKVDLDPVVPFSVFVEELGSFVF